MTDAVCPLCGGNTHDLIGATCHGEEPTVAGVPIDLAGSAKELLRCGNCGLIFKYPPVPEAKLTACYAKARNDHWELDPDPHVRQFDLFRGVLSKFSPGKRILDVGCFNGAFLAGLGADWVKHGIEPSAEAGRLAESRGVCIIGSDIHAIDSTAHQFDAVVSFDVAEHISLPLKFFEKARSLLRPDGILVTMTGSTDSYIWKWHRNRTWYASLPEHVSFYSRKTMDYLCHRLGMDLVLYQPMAHKNRGLAHSGLNYGRHATHAVLLRTAQWMRISSRIAAFRRSAPPAFSLADHALTLMRCGTDASH